MKLSVVIVNYNVRHFLDQCLKSVYRSLKDIDSEVFVVDNHSVDGSVEMLRESYPQVKLIANTDNVGFSRANNQAIREARGEYVLLLNPDTVVEEDTFRTCIEFMDSHAEAGAMGVKLIDGKGKYLPESKRGLPTPEVAFYKISGLSAIFPASPKFGKYHMGFLPVDETNEIEILSGAFMFIRHEALKKTGLLDETFFMYGEDIDLSYRITKAGFRIYYHPKTRVIHYRGESTKKSTVNYVFVFYQAMIIFANKHFMPKRAKLFSLVIKLAVYLRAGISVVKRLAQKLWLPLTEALVFFGGMFILKNYWAAKSGIYYPYAFLWVAVPLYILSWTGGSWLSGAYERPYRILRSLRGIVIGTIIILVVYALLDEQHRYSRFLTLVGAGWAATSSATIRLVFNLIFQKTFFAEQTAQKRILIIGDFNEAERVAALLNQSPVKTAYLGFVNPVEGAPASKKYHGKIEDLREMVEVLKINELIFCGKDLSSARIMDYMMAISHPELEYKIAPPESLFIIGSNSIQANGDLYTVGLNSVDKPDNRRKKRILDVIASLVIMTISPILLITSKNNKRIFSNCFDVLFNKKTWIGYAGQFPAAGLPTIKQGILTLTCPFKQEGIERNFADQLNILYAKDYSTGHDVQLLIQCFDKLGR
ncbi:MAG: glycosyltransferase [Bacteroidia bacterium]